MFHEEVETLREEYPKLDDNIDGKLDRKFVFRNGRVQKYPRVSSIELTTVISLSSCSTGVTPVTARTVELRTIASRSVSGSLRSSETIG